jgi:hypothetical protein
MAYYDALVTKWSTLSGTTAEKLAAVNAETVAGANVDVQISAVVGKLMLSGAYLPLAAFASGTASGDAGHDAALFAAKMLLTIITVPNAPAFQMSDPTNYATIKGMMDAILAWEIAHANTTGFTQAVHDALLVLAATAVPWWSVNGYSSPIGDADLVAAGELT